MGDRRRRIFLATLGVLAASLSVAAVAWACTPTADLQVDHLAGAPGTAMTFTGHGFANGPVEIRMDSVSAAPLVTTSGPDFSLTVTVPQTSPGYHVFGAVGYDSNGNAIGTASVSFEVTGPSSPSRNPTTPVTRHPAPPAAPAPVAPKHHAAAPHPRTTHPAAAAPRPVRVTAPATHPQTHARTHVAGRARASTPTSGARARSVVAHRVTHASAWGHGIRPSAAPMSHVPALAKPRAAQPAQLWAPKSEPLDGSGSPGVSTSLAIGIGMLAVGLVALFGGFTVAEVRRRRASARARRS